MTIRGQLRFWWRACRAARYGEHLDQLKAAEDVLWGAPSLDGYYCPARVEIAVVTTNPGKAEHPFTVAARGTGRPSVVRQEEVAPAYVFLAAPSCSSYITGEVLPVLGGNTAG